PPTRRAEAGAEVEDAESPVRGDGECPGRDELANRAGRLGDIAGEREAESAAERVPGAQRGACLPRVVRRRQARDLGRETSGIARAGPPSCFGQRIERLAPVFGERP